jgi:hypothetical protein
LPKLDRTDKEAIAMFTLAIGPVVTVIIAEIVKQLT